MSFSRMRLVVGAELVGTGGSVGGGGAVVASAREAAGGTGAGGGSRFDIVGVVGLARLGRGDAGCEGGECICS